MLIISDLVDENLLRIAWENQILLIVSRKEEKNKVGGSGSVKVQGSVAPKMKSYEVNFTKKNMISQGTTTWTKLRYRALFGQS